MKKGEKRKLLILMTCFVLYLSIGALIFKAVESKGEDGETKMTNVYERLKSEKNLTREEFKDYIKEIQTIYKITSHGSKWTFYSSLYFCGSVVTTIGYGHMTPKTDAGRIIVMFYAIIGIPLNLWTLKVMGDSITSLLSKLISKFDKVVLKKTEERHLKLKVVAGMAILNIAMLLIGGLMYKYSEKWTYLESVYYCFIVYSTIGFGDLVPDEGHKVASNNEIVMMFVRAFNLIIGLSLLSSLLSSIIQAADELKVVFPSIKVHPFQKTTDMNGKTNVKREPTPRMKNGKPRVIKVKETELEDLDNEQPKEKKLPTTKL